MRQNGKLMFTTLHVSHTYTVQHAHTRTNTQTDRQAEQTGSTAGIGPAVQPIHRRGSSAECAAAHAWRAAATESQQRAVATAAARACGGRACGGGRPCRARSHWFFRRASLQDIGGVCIFTDRPTGRLAGRHTGDAASVQRCTTAACRHWRRRCREGRAFRPPS